MKKQRKPLRGREVCAKKEYTRRTEVMAERQDQRCALCPFPFDGYLGQASFDHQDGRGIGGGHRDDRIEVDGQWQNAAVHVVCNTLKGSKRYHWKDGKYVPKEK